MKDIMFDWIGPIFLCFLMVFVVVLCCMLIYNYYRDL